MDEKLYGAYGVFFRDAEGAVYLAAVLGDEDEAIEEAMYLDQRQFESVGEEGEGEGDPPAWEDFDGMHYVGPVSASVEEETRDQLARGFVARVG
jgi:hypothetical protein